MAEEARDITATEAFALGALHGVLTRAGLAVLADDGIDIDNRYIDVNGLVPPHADGTPTACMRITIEEVR